MPSCFQLFKDGEAQSLNKIDEEICNLLGVEVDSICYGGKPNDIKSFNWFDTIGFTIATSDEKFLGSQELKDHYTKNSMWNKEEIEKILKIIEYLETNYSSKSFYKPKSVL